MGNLENIKKTSKIIERIGKVFQIMFGIMAGLLLLSAVILLLLRGTLNEMIAESQTSFDFRYMGQWAPKLAGEGKITEAFIAFAISGVLFSTIVTVIMHFIVRIFKRFCNDYSPFLPDIVKDLKIVSILITLLILRNSIGLGIIAGFIFLGIIQLYEYGCELQNQVDETL